MRNMKIKEKGKPVAAAAAAAAAALHGCPIQVSTWRRA